LSDVTRILESIEHGDPKAADELLPLVYEELRKLAASRMANERPNQTLQPTALVHEAWLRQLFRSWPCGTKPQGQGSSPSSTATAGKRLP